MAARREQSAQPRGWTLVLTLAFLIGGSLPAYAQADAAADFRQTCTSCHTIGGGRLTGPDLKNVEQRRERAWLRKFVTDPQGVLASGDAYALKLKEEAHDAVMPNVAGMTPERAAALLDLIAAESELEKSQFVGVQLSDRPLTPADVDRGRALFSGSLALDAGGPACVACHVVTGLGGLGGGRLGPDLTKVFERRQGRKGLAAWLSAPATPLMQANFRDRPLAGEEILALVAFFQDRARVAEHAHTSSTLLFLVIGLAGSTGLLLLFDRIWRHRFRTIRRTLVERLHVGDVA